MDFYDEVKRLAKQQGITVDTVCRRAFGDTPGSIDKYYGWFKRGLLPRLNDAYKIAQALGVPLDHFYPVESERCLKINELLAEFTDGEIKDLEVMLEAMISRKK